jgi:hypothetical protein
MQLGVGGIYFLPTFAAPGVLLSENSRARLSNGRVQDDSTTRGLNECQRDRIAGESGGVDWEKCEAGAFFTKPVLTLYN